MYWEDNEKRKQEFARHKSTSYCIFYWCNNKHDAKQSI